MERVQATPVAQFTLRMPPKLKEQMQKRAEHNHRSLNGEMIAVLETAVSQSDEEVQQQK